MPRPAKIERKTEYFDIMNGEIKATNDAQGIIEGYLNYFSNIDYGDDRTMPGAFKRTLADSYARKREQGLDFLFPYLWNHDFSLPPVGGIFEAHEDRKGLYIKVQMSMDTEMGRNIYTSFKSGFLRKQSMGYKAMQVEYVKDEETKRTIRNLLEVAVMEGSAVVFPMNDLAQVDTVKNESRRNFYMTGKMPTKQETPAIATTKDYAASYAQITQADWCSGLFNLLYPLRNEMMIAQMGEQPEEDVKVAIKQFTAAALAYMQRGIELNIAEYLQPDEDGNSPSMYMSADDNPETKAGRAISDANHKKIAYAADGIMQHVKTIRGVLNSAAQRANDLQGYPVYPTSSADPEPEQKTEEPTEEEDEATQRNKLRAKIYDLASLLQFQNAEKGI
jgi:Escherichia/Staphylococcus phage prohead protease